MRNKGIEQVLRDASTFTISYKNVSLGKIRQLIDVYTLIYDDVAFNITRSSKYYQLKLRGDKLV